MVEIVHTPEQMKRLIIRAIEHTGQETVPSKIANYLVNRERIPYRRDLLYYIVTLIEDSRVRHEGIFYKSRKGRNRYGLLTWKEKTRDQREALFNLMLDLGSFKTSEITERAKKEIGNNNTGLLISELIEEGRVRRVRIGFYEVIEQTE